MIASRRWSLGPLRGQVGSGTPMEALYARQQTPVSGELPASLGPWTLLRYLWWMVVAPDPQRFRGRIGALALASHTPDEASRRAVIASRLPVDTWSERPLQLTAVHAVTGEFKVFDRTSGVSLIDAVAASCAVPGVWPPVTIGADRWIDGGMRSAANADLAAGQSPIVVLAPITFGFGPLASLASQVAVLRDAGSKVVVVSPDAAARRIMGRNSLDPTKRGPAAAEGYRQGAVVAAEVGAVWNG